MSEGSMLKRVFVVALAVLAIAAVGPAAAGADTPTSSLRSTTPRLPKTAGRLVPVY